MTRRLFGGTTSDTVYTSQQGLLAEPNTTVVLTCWDSPTTVSFPLTDLQDINGNPITTVSTDVTGQIPQFYGPNDGHTQMWIDANGGAGPRQLILGYPPVRLAAVGNTANTNLTAGATETTLATGAIPPALKAGATVRVVAFGTVAVGGTAGTVTARVRIGGLTGTIAFSLTTASLTLSTTYNWWLRMLLQLQSGGPPVPFSTGGEFVIPVAGSTAAPNIVEQSGTFDNSVSQPLVVTMVASSATTSAICKGALFEQVV